ncbi:MAG: PqqD family peptide modification chaperone [Lamprocystis purpurea]|uniref:PqqD family peptide modification chaperone n=1 Tax=Lamprocystis purpurea TaxID=61598 RepID=UPI000399D12A|nr:PqqD family peptide modification chaperone [Lamprocystis purpurea]MBV5274924.1 PqqD family peptide modification chaperone [Lamprocystis purpurea]
MAGGRVLARHASERLFVLNPPAAALWDLYTGGLDPEAIAALLSRRYGLTENAARAQIQSLVDAWRQAGLVADRQLPPAPPAADANGFLAGERPACERAFSPPPQAELTLDVADRRIGLDIDLVAAKQPLATLLHSLRSAADGPLTDYLHLSGTAADWLLRVDGAARANGRGTDAAVVGTLSALIDLGCRPHERLLVIHGAGLALEDGRGLLLIAPGGSGKTTLAAALNAGGFGLLSDDVVPVTPDGALVGLGMPLCLKSGSWPVLAACRPELAAIPVTWRHGQAVRFLTPRGPRVATPRPLGLMLFPRYAPGSAPRLDAMDPVAVLQGVVEAESVIRDLTQAKLTAITRWVSEAPAFALTCPDLESGLELVRQALTRVRP